MILYNTIVGLAAGVGLVLVAKLAHVAPFPTMRGSRIEGATERVAFEMCLCAQRLAVSSPLG